MFGENKVLFFPEKVLHHLFHFFSRVSVGRLGPSESVSSRLPLSIAAADCTSTSSVVALAYVPKQLPSCLK